MKNTYVHLPPISLSSPDDRGPGWKQLITLTCLSEAGDKIPTTIAVSYTIMFAPGQVFAIPFQLPSDLSVFTLQCTVTLLDLDTRQVIIIELDTFVLKGQSWKEAQNGFKITTDGYDNSIQYGFLLFLTIAYAKPPKEECTVWQGEKCPIVVALHGAGVEVESGFWLSAVNQQEYAWTLFPSGRTSWGFDWHGPSFKNMEASLEGLLDLNGIEGERNVTMFFLTFLASNRSTFNSGTF